MRVFGTLLYNEIRVTHWAFSHTIYSLFCAGIDLNLHFYHFFSKISWFIEKWKKKDQWTLYCKNEYTYKFHVFTVKTNIRNMSKSREFRWKTDSKCAQDDHFAIFLPKKSERKLEKLFSVIKRGMPKNFMRFRIKSAFRKIC